MAKTILAVDDSKTMRDMVTFALTEAGFEVTQAADGKAALAVLGNRRVDCVITDLNMPIMDGLQLIRELRTSPVHRATPILMLTTEADESKKKAGREAGATGWLIKPFNPAKLVETVLKVCP